LTLHCQGAGQCAPETLAKFGEVVEQHPGSIKLKVKRDRVVPVCKALLDELPVQDLDIEEVPIEDVIRSIFAR
jgi:ABC-2 type transport system ATP-binding protein